MKNLYIAVEGVDGAGSTTISLAFSQAIGGIRIVEPSTEPIGNLIRAQLAGGVQFPLKWTEEILAHLFVAARLAMQGAIEKELEAGPVVSDRCLLSTYVYQPAVSWLNEAHKNVRAPDVIVFLNTPPEVAFQRLHSRPHREAFEDLRSIKEHARRYLAYASDPPGPLLAPKWLVVDGTMPVEEIVVGLVDNELTRLSS